ncbi:hypothetical protein V5799_008064 [Amblyomma americanum]|uniref:Serpin domain-containing protein n=1 Tax=Amblyomma americanum TaxID=6943 RepID=A0AAQ4FFU8_AMBAM
MDASGSSSNGASTPDRRAQPRRQDQEQQEDRIQDRGSQPQQRDHQQDHQQAQLARTSSRRDAQPTRHRRRQSRNSSTPSSSDSTTAASSGTTLTQTSRSQSLDLEASGHRRSQACIPRRWRRLSPSASPFSLPPELCGPLLQLPLDLCAALRRGGERGNVLLSPHYAACILVMMHHGAAGNTRHQLGHLLGFPEDDSPTRCVDIGATVLEIPFESPLVESMLVFLPDLASPDKPDGLGSLERSLSTEKILDCLARLEYQGPVDITLPRIRLHCVIDLAHLMPAMGAPDAFGEAADFSNMGNVTSSERSEGGGAGACTTAQSTPPALPPIADYDERPSFDFTVDRPFLFLVLGRDPDSVLLFGSVTRAL